MGMGLDVLLQICAAGVYFQTRRAGCTRHDTQAANECKTRASGARFLPTVVSDNRDRIVPSP